ncbi:MAG: hypothetical protein KG075_09455 [Alphaproteobacteria bacterium]|nr:hypothetical protein [Alphaproteobacteria bacterium]MBS4046553.1 hypothetical protein [Alphaproteobacteria bacterium]
MRNAQQSNLVPSAPNAATTQAGRVFARFGGVPKLHQALKALQEFRRDRRPVRDISTIYRWDLPAKNGGTGGLIPAKAMNDILAAARLEGIVLTPEDLFPR